MSHCPLPGGAGSYASLLARLLVLAPIHVEHYSLCLLTKLSCAAMCRQYSAEELQRYSEAVTQFVANSWHQLSREVNPHFTLHLRAHLLLSQFCGMFSLSRACL